jgi:hypothetical protein
MKKLLRPVLLVALAFGFSSCCSMFGITSQAGHYRTETRQVKTCRYDTVTEEIHTGGKDGMIQTIEKKVPRYKTVTRRVRVAGSGACVRLYCPGKDRCGTTSQSTLNMVTAQPATGSPHIGLIPTMKPLAP